MKAVLRKIRISPKKVNLVAGIVREKKVSDALATLKFMPKKAAKIIYKVVQSAAANAKNNFKQSPDDLFITRLLVTKGPTYKRSLPISRGRTHPILKRTSHITVEVGVKTDISSDKTTTAKSSDNAVKTQDLASQKKKESVKKSAVKKKDKE